MIAFKVVLQGKLVTFRELLVYLAFRLVFDHCPRCFYFICRASRQPITRVKFKFVARQVVASVVIRAAKLKFVAESRTRVYFAQHVASTCNTVFAARQVGHKQTEGFNLQCNNAARQVEEKCSPRFRFVIALTEINKVNDFRVSRDS